MIGSNEVMHTAKAPALILGGPQWKTDQEPNADLAMTPRVTAQKEATIVLDASYGTKKNPRSLLYLVLC